MDKQPPAKEYFKGMAETLATKTVQQGWFVMLKIFAVD
jgi:phage terminase large subunit-like protein